MVGWAVQSIVKPDEYLVSIMCLGLGKIELI